MTRSYSQEWEREQKRLHQEKQQANADRLNIEIERKLRSLDEVLATGLDRDLKINFDAMKVGVPKLALGNLASPARRPRLEDFLPKRPGFMASLVPGAEERYARREQRSRRVYEEAEISWKEQEAARQRDVKRLQSDYETVLAKAKAQHRRVEELRADWRTGKRAAVEECLRKVLSDGPYPTSFPRKFSCRYLPSRKELLLEQQLPLAREVIPAEASWKYVKTRDVVEARNRTIADVDRPV